MPVRVEAESHDLTLGAALTHSWTHTVGTDGSHLLVCFTVNGATEAISGVTFNGIALTQLVKILENQSITQKQWVYIYGLLAPAVGAHLVEITLSASRLCVGGALSFTGAEAGVPFGPVASNRYVVGGSYQALLTVPCIAVEDLVVAASGGQSGSDPAPGPHEVRMWNLADGFTRSTGFFSPASPPSTLVTATAGVWAWAIAGVVVKGTRPASASRQHGGVITDSAGAVQGRIQ